MESLVGTFTSLSSPIPSPPHYRRLRGFHPTVPVVALPLSRQALTTVRSSSPSPHVHHGRGNGGGVLEVAPTHHKEEGRSGGGGMPEGFDETSSSREVEEERACAGCGAQGLVLCATCSGSGLYVDAILESQGVIVDVTCLAYYLNPKYHYKHGLRRDHELLKAVQMVISKLVKGVQDQTNAMNEIKYFRDELLSFGTTNAVHSRNKTLPGCGGTGNVMCPKCGGRGHL